MKKRITILMTTLLLTISVCVGCGAESTTTEETETATATTTEESIPGQAIEATATPEETTAPTLEATEEPSEEMTAETEPETETSETAEQEPTEEPTSEPEPQATYTYTDMSATMYAQQTVNIRDLPDTSGNKLGSLSTNDEIKISAKCNETGWYMFEYNGSVAFVSNKYVGETKIEIQQNTATAVDNSTPSSASGYFYQNEYGQTLRMTYDEVRAEASKKYPLYQIIDNGTDRIEIYYICNHFRGNPTTPPDVSFAGSAELDALTKEANRILEERNANWQSDVERYDYYDGHNYSVQKQIYTW